MDEIAADVGMAKPSLYYYYSTKEQLFTAVVSREQESFVRDVEMLLKKEITWSRKLKGYVATRVKLFRELVNLSQLGANSWPEMKRVAGHLFEKLERQELVFLQAIMEGGKAAGEFAVGDTHTTARLVLHLLQGLRLRILRSEQGPTLSDASYADLGREMDLLIDHLIIGLQNHS